ncbi:MAG TPA: hypothetical protein VD710_02795 [Nitrososphaeraceae archaeon]|nr:hypothetical protein [Nitrososphaeraceae archaeon]
MCSVRGNEIKQCISYAVYFGVSAMAMVPIAYAIDVYQKNELPFGKPYEDWF